MRSALLKPGRTVVTDGPVSLVALNDRDFAFAVGRSQSDCDHVELWDTVTGISFWYIVLGCLFQGAQTVLTALGWYGILRYAYPAGVTFMPVLAAYATGVALNGFLPANIGTFVTLLMYVAIVQGATFPGLLAG